VKAQAIAYGAITIINAIATGKGGAMGIDLWTKASVELNNTGKVECKILSDPNEKDILVKEVFRTVLKKFGKEGLGAKIVTDSNIPISRGLKSSSAAANAVALATTAALGEKLSDLEVVNLGVDAAISAGVTITGAFDDATASFLGGITVTDNKKRMLLKRFNVDENLKVILYIPSTKIPTAKVNLNRIQLMKPYVEEVFSILHSKEDFLKAMTLNGLIYAAALKYDSEIIMKALTAGALAAGISGTGPAVAAISYQDNVEKIVESWSDLPGEVRVVNVNNKKAHLV